MSVLVDTNVLIAFFNEKDERKERATELLKRVSAREFGTPYLSDYVFDEFMTFTYARLKDKRKTLEIGKNILSNELELSFCTPEVFREAFELFEKTSGLSFTDCIIAASALEQGASVASFDEGFKQIKGLKLV